MSDDVVDDDEILYRRISAGRNLYKRKIEIEPVPLAQNLAHTEIYVIPMFTDEDSRAFRRLCRSLARLAMNHWEIMPQD